MSRTEPFPGVAKFLLEGALYVQYEFKSYGEIKPSLTEFEGPLDSYCVNCERHSIFHLNSTVSMEPFGTAPFFACTRDDNHTMYFVYRVSILKNPPPTEEEVAEQLKRLESAAPSAEKPPLTWVVTKFGQYPSIRDLAEGELGRYRKVLSDQAYSELNTAVGLIGHGVGIGSFVYLRRVFEGFVDEAHEKARTDSGWDEQLFKDAQGMAEKVKLLAAHLPSKVVNFKEAYGVLSKGIHQLDESEEPLAPGGPYLGYPLFPLHETKT